MAKSQTTERQSAPDPVPQQVMYQQVPLQQMQVERMGTQNEPYTRRFPQIRGGQCEFCGTLDPNQPGNMQYKLCPHYRGKTIRCSYCADTKDPDEVIAHSALNVAESPDRPGTLVVWCDSYECSQAHLKRFRKNA